MLNSVYGNYRTRKFTDVYDTANTFINDFKTSPLGFKEVNSETVYTLDDNSLELIYYLLYGRYGNSHVASSDENMFKYKLYGLVYAYGPTFIKKQEIQEKLRGLDLATLKTGSKIIYNQAANPGTAPSTGDLTELQYINNQNTSNQQKGTAQAYIDLYAVLRDDLVKYFLDKFKVLFLVVVEPQEPLWYVTEVADDTLG